MALVIPASEVEPDESGSRFQSDMFTLCVGPDARLFKVHEAVLFQSPVFAVFCSAEFKEKHDRCINLPDDDPEIFGYLIHYLYAQDYYNLPRTRDPSVQAKELGTMYLLGEKYQLDRLKRITVNKLKHAMKAKKDAMIMFEMAQRIYDNVPDSDEDFRKYFLSILPECLTYLSLANVTAIMKDVIPTNVLWKDIFEASLKLVRKQHQDLARLDETDRKHAELRENFIGLEGAKKRIEKKHYDKHPTCTWCK
ncbi:MAG: hypothetical protein M1836_000750 [Candelina mexicana]|nr:MAG: hypothetical protein M1836_000750 [Candelina mexicana]